MTLIALLIALIIVGAVLHVVPMNARIKNFAVVAVIVVAAIIALLWLSRHSGLV